MRASLLLPLLLLLGCPDATPQVAPTPSTRPSPAIATASPGLAEMVCALGAEAHLVGVSKWCAFPSSLQRLPRIGGMVDPNLEAIDAIAPDVILMGGTSRPVQDLATRRGYRLQKHVVDSIDGVYQAMSALGKLLSREEAAAREVERIKAALGKYASNAPSPRPKVLLVFGHRAGRLGQVSAPGRGTFLSQCLSVAGGDSVLTDLPASGYPMLSQEVLLQKAPEVIVELSAEPLSPEVRAAMRRDWSALSSIPAVKNNKIAIVTGAVMMIPGPRLDQVVGKFARALAGELDVE